MENLMFWGMIVISSLVIGMSIYILIAQAYLNKLFMDKFNDQKRELRRAFGGGRMNQEQIDNVNKPSHYQGRYGMESIDALRNFMTPEQLKGFYLGNNLKYLLRHQKKNGLEDLKKARKNLDWLIEEMENEN